MYVDETGADDTTDTTATDGGHDELTVEVGGEEYEVQENYDYDQDGENDTAVVQTDTGYMAFADTDGDGTADTMIELDEQGGVTATAEYDEASGEWAEVDPGTVTAPSGDGADDGGSTTDRPSSSDDGDAGATATPASTGSEGDITVGTSEGEVVAGEAQYDADGDGVNDTAVVTDEQGNTYAFTDSDGDGSADEAIVIEADGDVTVAQNSGDDEWTTVETGHINPDGTYVSEGAGATSGAGASTGATTGADAAWQG